MDAYEIGLKLAIPETLREGLVVVTRGLTVLDKGAQAAWAGAHGVRTAGLRGGPTAAPGKQDDRKGSSDDVVGTSPAAGGEMLPRGGIMRLPGVASSMPPKGGAGAVQDRQIGADAVRRHGEAGSTIRTIARLMGVAWARGTGARLRSAESASTERRAKLSVGEVGHRRGLASSSAVTDLSSQEARNALPEYGSAEIGFLSPATAFPDSSPEQATGSAETMDENGVWLLSDIRTVIGSGRAAPSSGHANEPKRPMLPISPRMIGVSTRQASMPEQAEADGGGGLFSMQATAPDQGGDGGERQSPPVLELDGRIIGQLLGERLGRDASRPGAGTTFFDPRQSPAWTPSGSL